jgi:orotidine-5'-phosphate decarboxylase
MKNFADRLIEAIKEKENPSCVGLDPRIGSIPEHIRQDVLKRYGNNKEAVAEAIVKFNTEIIDAIADIVPAMKPQIAFYEKYGSHGIEAFEKTIDYAKSKGLLVIGDTKRNDIGSTAQAYADGHLGKIELCDGSQISGFDVDAMTVNAYLGIDGIKPFMEHCGKYRKGIFILDKTSNPSAGDLQDKTVELEDWQVDLINEHLQGVGVEPSDLPQMQKIKEKNRAPNYVLMATLIHSWGKNLIGEKGYSSVGAVIGATYPQEAKVLRKIMPNTLILVPGYGAQGATAEDVVHLFNDDGYGAIVNSARGIIFAYQKEPYKSRYSSEKFGDAARAAALDMKNDITQALKKTINS